MSNMSMELIVTTKNGEIQANFDQLQKKVEAMANEYAVVVYSGSKEEALKLAKEDRATLKKLIEELNDS